MSGINSIDELDAFLGRIRKQKPDAQPKQDHPLKSSTPQAMSPAPAAAPQIQQPPKEIKSDKDVDQFLSTVRSRPRPQQPAEAPLMPGTTRKQEEWFNRGYEKTLGTAQKGLDALAAPAKAASAKLGDYFDKHIEQGQSELQKMPDWQLHAVRALTQPFSGKSDQDTRNEMAANITFWGGMERDIGKKTAEFALDPLNWPFFFSGGPEVRPLLTAAVDTMFTGMMVNGAWTGFRNAYEIGKAKNWEVADGSPESHEFWKSIEDAGVNLWFGAESGAKIPHAVEMVKTYGRFEDTARQQFGRPWRELTASEKAQVTNRLTVAAVKEKGLAGFAEVQGQAQQFGLKPTPEDQARVGASFKGSTKIADEERATKARRLAEDIGRANAVIANAPKKRESMDHAPLNVDGPILLSPSERMFHRQEVAEAEARAVLETERVERERGYEEKLKRVREAMAQQQDSGLHVTDTRRWAPNSQAAGVNYEKAQRVSAVMDKVAEENLYESAEDMLRSLREKRPRGKELSDLEKRFLDLDRERRYLVRMTDLRELEPVKQTSDQAETKRRREEISLVQKESRLRDAADTMQRQAETAKSPEEADTLAEQADEAREIAAEVRTEMEIARAARAAQTGDTQVFPIGAPVNEAVRGKSASIILPDKRKLAFHYAVVPMDDLMVSHDPSGNFEVVEEYPQPLQPRDYKNNKVLQADVASGGKNPEPSMIINDAATGHEGPAVIREDGVVAGGNGRTMRMMLAYKEGKGQLYHDLLLEKAAQFGIDPEKIPDVADKPVLVRVLDEPVINREDLIRVGQDLNRNENRGYGEAEQSLAAARRMPEADLQWVANALDAMGEDASIRDLLRHRGDQVMQRMVAAGMWDPTKQAEFVTPEGELTNKAKELFENALFGKVVNDASLLATVPRSVLNKLDRALPALAKIKANGDVWDISDYLKDSLRLWKKVDSIREHLNEVGEKDDSLVDKYLRPGNYKMGSELMDFGEGTVRETPHPITEAIAKLLEKNSAQVKDAFSKYADDSEGTQMMIGEPPNARESFNQHIGEKVGIEVKNGEWGTATVAPEGKHPREVLEAHSKARDEARAAKAEQATQAAPPIEMSPSPQEPVGSDTSQQVPQKFDQPFGEAKLREAISAHPAMKPDMVEAAMAVVRNFAEKYLGISVDEYLRRRWAGVSVGGSKPAEGALNQKASAQQEKLITDAGGIPLGTSMGLLWFNVPEHKSTLAVPEDSASADSIRKTIAESMRRMLAPPDKLYQENYKFPPDVPEPMEGPDKELSVRFPLKGSQLADALADQVLEDLNVALAVHEDWERTAKRFKEFDPEASSVIESPETARWYTRNIIESAADGEEANNPKLREMILSKLDPNDITRLKRYRINDTDVLYQEGSKFGMGMTPDELDNWVRRAGRGIKVEQYGEQGGLFDGGEQQYRLTNKSTRERTIVTQSQLKRLAEINPAIEGKSAQQGLFGADEPGILFQEQKPIWFLKSERVAADPKMPNSAPGKQWSEILKKNGIGQDEMKWAGLDDFLKDKKKVTRQELQDFIRDSNVQVTEVLRETKQGDAPPPMNDIHIDWPPEGRYVVKTLTPASHDRPTKGHVFTGHSQEADEDFTIIYYPSLDTWEAWRGEHGESLVTDDATSYQGAQEAVEEDFLETEKHAAPEDAPKFSDYTLPGGKNYKELLLTLPQREVRDLPSTYKVNTLAEGAGGGNDYVNKSGDKFIVQNSMGVPLYIGEHDTEAAAIAAAEKYREKNPLPTRLRDRNVDNFTSGHFSEPNVLAHIRITERADADGKRVLFLEEVQSDWHQKGRRLGYKDHEWQKKEKELRAAATNERNKLKPLLEKLNWLGYDTPTEVLNDIARGDLPSRNVDVPPDVAIAMDVYAAAFKEYNTVRETGFSGVPDAPFKKNWHELALKRALRYAAENGFDRVAWTPGEVQIERYDLSRHLDAIGYNRIDGNEIDLVLFLKNSDKTEQWTVSAQKLEALVGKDIAQRILSSKDKEGRLSGLDLKVGGEGMRGFYDKIVPDFLNNYGKKWGAKVGKTKVVVGKSKISGAAMGMELNPKYVDNHESVPSIDITGEMKKSVLQGQPLFQNKKGATEFIHDGRAVLHLFESADISTMLHESAHIFRRDLKPEDRAVVETWLKIKDGKWNRESEEKFARAFERYFYDGKAPVPEVETLFAKIKAWLVGIYEQLAGSPINIKLSPEVRAVFDRMMGKDKAEPAPLEEAAPARKTKVKAATKIEPMAISPAEAEGASLKAEGGEQVPDGTNRHEFKNIAAATGFARRNKENLKGIKIFETKKGKVFADYLPKSDDVKMLFQEEFNDPKMIDRRIRAIKAELIHIMPNSRREALVREINTLEDRKVQPLLIPPSPEQTVKLWTPEGERSVGKKPEVISDTQRGLSDAPAKFLEPEGSRKVSERGERPGIVAEDGAAGRATRTGAKDAPAGGATEPVKRALRAVPDAKLDAPKRERGNAIYSPDEWKKKVDLYKLPENAPAPSVKLSPEIRRLLIFPGQPEVAESILSGLRQHDAFIVGTSTGTGKTYLGSAILAEMQPKTTLIITKNRSLIHSQDTGWVDVAANFGIDVQELPTGVTEPPGPGTYIATYAKLRDMEGIDKYPWDMVVSDESAEARRWYADSKQGAMLKSLAGNANKVLFMSATPFHTALEMGYMDKLGLWQSEGFEKWGRQFGVYRDPEGNLAGGNAPRKLIKLREQLVERGQFINIDRNMDGYQASFAVVPMDGATMEGVRNIDKAFRLAQEYFQNKGQRSMVRAVKGNAVTFMKSYLERQRLPQAVETAKKLEANGWKVIIFSEHKKEITELYDFLKPADAGTGGEISRLLPKLPGVTDVLTDEFGDDIANFSGPHTAAREKQKVDFLSGDKRHLYATYGAGGIGVSLHDTKGDAPRAVIYLGPPWSGVMFDQAIGRPWRYGTKSNVHAIFMVSNAKPEMRLILEKVAPRLESLRAAVSGIHEGDPMVKAMKSLDSARDSKLAYELGQEQKSELNDFLVAESVSPVSTWKEIPIQSAEKAKNKGMKYPGHQMDAPPSVIKLFQDEPPDDFVLPEELEAAERSDKVAKDFTDGAASPAVPGSEAEGVQAAVAAIPVLDRAPLGDAIAQHAASETKGSEDPVAAAMSTWRLAFEFAKDTQLGEYLGEGKDAIRGADTYMFTHGREVIRKMGKGGAEIADGMIPEYHVRAGNYGGKLAVDAISIFEKHNFPFKKSAEFEHLVDVLEKVAKPKDAREEAIARDLRKWFFDAQDLAVAKNVMIELFTDEGMKSIPFPQARDEQYFPHRYDRSQFKEGRRRETILQHLMKKRGLSRQGAEDALLNMGRDHPLAGHVERAREGDFEGYRKDPLVLLQYARELGEAVSRTEVFGQHRQKLDAAIFKIEHAKDRQQARGVMDQLLAPKHLHRDSRALTRFATDTVVLLKMPFSAFPAMSQTFKAGLFANNRSLVQGLVKTMFQYKGAWHAAMESGSILDAARAAMMREMGAGGISEKALSLYGFNLAHYWGRIVADQTARVFIEKYALPKLIKDSRDSYMRRVLTDKFALNDQMIDAAIQNRKWSAEDYNRAGKRNADSTQFTYDQTEIPPSWSIDPKLPPKSQFAEAFLHTMFLLQRTAYRNGVLLKEALLKEASKGNLRPWLVFFAAVSVGDELMADLYAMLHGDTRRFSSLMDPNYYGPGALAKRELENLAFHGGLGMVKMVLDPIRYGTPMSEVLIGPFFGTLATVGDQIFRDYPKVLGRSEKAKKKESDLHMAWRHTWGTAGRVYPPLKVVQKLTGVPGETKKQKHDREKRETRFQDQRYGASKKRSEDYKMAPTPVQ